MKKLKRGGRMKTYDDDWSEFCKWLGINKKRDVSVPKPPKGKITKYMMVNDLHIPFHNPEAVKCAIEHGKQEKVDKLIVGGDTLDCYSLSRFSKFLSVSIRDEYKQARLFFDYASRSFNEVLVLSGNHEAREKKYFSSKLTADELQWLLVTPMLNRVAQDMANVKIIKNVKHETDMNWFAQIGKDVIVGHPERSSVYHLKPVDDFRRWIDCWGDALGVNPRPRMIIAGHSHNAGMSWSGNTLIVENGCLCQFQSYALAPSLYSKPQRLAYTTWEMNDGNVVVNSVKQHYPFADK
jgi:predicted phosphodiesterase